MDEGIIKGHKETFEGDEYVYFLDSNDCFKGVYKSQNLLSCTLKLHAKKLKKKIKR